MKALKLSVALLILCKSTLFCDDKLDSYISKNKKEQFDYDLKKNEAESSKLRDSWIAPLNLNYTNAKSNPYKEQQTSESTSVKMDQTVFQSGGIYYGIKFAEASKIYSNYSIDVAKRKLIKDAVSLLMQIKQLELKISKQKLQIKNSEINLTQKKEGYLNGQLDSGFLDSAIVERNVMIQTLYDIETNKERVISKFHVLSDLDYESALIPNLSPITKEQFLEQNIVLGMSESEIIKNGYAKDLRVTKYLPKVNVTAGYNWDESDSTFQFGTNKKEYYNFGVKATLPIDINSFRDVESAKIDYLKSKLVVADVKKELNAIFEQVMQNIENLERKKQLSIENRDIYDKLLSDTQDLFRAGYKTEYDVEMLQNSLEIHKSDIKIYEIDKDLELLTLYEMYKNEI